MCARRGGFALRQPPPKVPPEYGWSYYDKGRQDFVMDFTFSLLTGNNEAERQLAVAPIQYQVLYPGLEDKMKCRCSLSVNQSIL